MKTVVNSHIIYPQLSYSIIGVLFDVYNQLGPGHKEKNYQNAIALAFRTAGISFQEQIYVPLMYRNSKVGSYYFDFFIEGKIILEIKVDSQFLRRDINQVLGYLKSKDLKLGILANFGKDQLKFKRILNLY